MLQWNEIRPDADSIITSEPGNSHNDRLRWRQPKIFVFVRLKPWAYDDHQSNPTLYTTHREEEMAILVDYALTYNRERGFSTDFLPLFPFVYITRISPECSICWFNRALMVVNLTYHHYMEHTKSRCNANSVAHNFSLYLVNSLCPSDAIRRKGAVSTLAQVMAWCLTAPSHYLNQCWLIFSKVLWHSSEGIIMTWEDLKILNSKARLQITFLESHSDLPGDNELKIGSSLAINPCCVECI